MPKTKKEVAEVAVEKVKAVAEDAKATVKAAAETVTEKAEATVEKAKAAAKTRRTAKKADAPKVAAKKPAAKAAKLETKVVIELPHVAESTDSLIESAKADWIAKGNVLADMKQLTLYINAAEGMVYYVVNDDYLSGNFAI